MNESNQEPRVVFVGHVCIDRNVVEGVSYVGWGSPAVYMTKYFQTEFRLQPTIITRYGQDFAPYAEGVSLCPAQPDAEHSLVYENIVTNGHRTQYCRHDAAVKPERLTDEAAGVLCDADVLFVTPLTPAYDPAFVASVAAAVPAGCLKVLLPQGYLRHIGDDGLVSPREFTEADAVLPFFDLVILSDEDYPEAEACARAWKRASPRTSLIVTRNAYGADIIGGEETEHIPTRPVPPEKIIDSVGCGDVFSAATAYHLHRAGNLATAIRAGHAAARKKLMTPRAA